MSSAKDEPRADDPSAEREDLLGSAPSRPYLVVTGSSAGGIEALIALVEGLPADFAAPVVIAQHLAPNHSSRLEKILSARTKLTVRTIVDREQLQPGIIYLVGPDHDVEIVDSSASIIAIARSGPKPSIDLLFSSAAQTHGDRLIGIIFSGMGSDGLAGARLIKEHGGSVLVQDPTSAPFPSMPLAIPPSLVDIFEQPERMAATLVRLLQWIDSPRDPADESNLAALLKHVHQQRGIDFTQYKMSTVRRRLSRLMVAAKVESIAEYQKFLRKNPGEYLRLVNAFLIKVTEFFRDPALFEYLRLNVLPQLLKEARNNGNELRIWSAGTSTGEEAYSLAILCAELLKNHPEEITVRIFATDLDESAIGFARRGVFSREAVAQLPAEWVAEYFVKVGDTYEVGKRIRNMTVFGLHDLGQRAPFPRIDLCLCRNVLIYFTKELQLRALQLFAFSVRPGGVAVLGKAESMGALPEYFRVIDSTLRIYERYGERVVVPAIRSFDRPTSDVHPSLERGVRSTVVFPPVVAAQRPHSNMVFSRFLAEAPIGFVVVDRRYDILHVNAAARLMLDIHGIAIGDDLIHQVSGIESAPLRSFIDRAFNNESPTQLEIPVKTPSGDISQWLQITAVHEATDTPQTEIVGLFIHNLTELISSRLEFERKAEVKDRQLTDLTNRVAELTGRQKSLLQANDDLVYSNADLRNVNEQLLVQTEEAAAASEEVETLNEEMQATNEELETLNEELQATIEELNTTNDELEARSEDLERLAKTRELEIDRAVAERLAVGTALEALLGTCAVLGAENEVVYASRALGPNDIVARKLAFWRPGEIVELEGKNFLPELHPTGESTLTVLGFKLRL